MQPSVQFRLMSLRPTQNTYRNTFSHHYQTVSVKCTFYRTEKQKMLQ